MSTATHTAVPVTDPSPSVRSVVNDLMAVLYGDRRDCALHFKGRSPAGFGETAFDTTIDKYQPTARITKQLGCALDDGGWSLHVTAAMGKKSRALRPGVPDISHLAFLPVRFHIPITYRHPTIPGHPYGRKWVPDLEGRAAAVEALAGFPLTPTAVLWGGYLLAGDHQVVGLFDLDEPVDVGTRDAEESVMATMRSLAGALGATVPDADTRLRDLLVPIPGSRVRSGAGLARAGCLELDPSRVYSMKQIESAIARARKAK